MRLNEGVVIEGVKCTLVPYTKELVETYHSWFVSDPELLELTGSELLTLEEEYVNQESWRTDDCKLTFLIRDKLRSEHPLCGDINAFFSEFFETDWDDNFEECTPRSSGLVAEINLMIADKESRRKGIARESLEIFTSYVLANIPSVKIFVAKIQLHNDASIKLFESLGFSEFKRVECFNEVHYIKRV
jgi:RimJ/RimL family protein N-acetyltransferase